MYFFFLKKYIAQLWMCLNFSGVLCDHFALFVYNMCLCFCLNTESRRLKFNEVLFSKFSYVLYVLIVVRIWTGIGWSVLWVVRDDIFVFGYTSAVHTMLNLMKKGLKQRFGS